MADELKLSFNLAFAKSGALVDRNHSLTLDVAGDSFSHEVQSVGTSEEVIAQGTDVGTPGYIYIVNLDDTNFVEIGVTTGVYTVKLLAGEVAVFRANGATIYAKADTGACLVEYILIEE